jgi:tetratricopeptide (TPR) repeat protein
MAGASLNASEAAEPASYRAFISYSHRDKVIARRLHRVIEAYRVPKKLVGRSTVVGDVPRRLTPIFRDREELPASADLGGELTAALRRSLFLIVICSRSSARSQWVDQEILQFKRTHGEARVLALVVDGEPNASTLVWRADEECFPKSLRYRLGLDGELSETPSEPIAADIRHGADGWRLAKLKLIAGLTALSLNDLVQREAQRRAQRLAVVASSATAGMVLTGALALYANASRIEANRQREIAIREAATAQAASDYLVSTFELTNPATENPRTITALTILGRSAERAKHDLIDQPQLQARLLSTLGRAYNNLGLLDEARAAFETSLPQLERAGPDGADALLTLAWTYAKQGALDKGLQMVRRAQALLGPDVTKNTRLRALAFYRASSDAPPAAIAAALNNRGLLLSDDGQFAAAELSLTESLNIYRRTLGENHLSTGQAWFTLAQNAFLSGDLPLAEKRIANALKIERAMLDADNPIFADALSLQGQIYQGQGKLVEARTSLREAITIYRNAYGGPHYLIGIAEVYLGLIESTRGNVDAALAVLDDAKRNYDASYGKPHPNHGDLLVNRATVLARANRMAEARDDCAAGIAILNGTLGRDASFTKSMTATCTGLAPPAAVKRAARS